MFTKDKRDVSWRVDKENYGYHKCPQNNSEVNILWEIDPKNRVKFKVELSDSHFDFETNFCPFCGLDLHKNFKKSGFKYIKPVKKVVGKAKFYSCPEHLGITDSKIFDITKHFEISQRQNAPDDAKVECIVCAKIKSGAMGMYEFSGWGGNFLEKLPKEILGKMKIGKKRV